MALEEQLLRLKKMLAGDADDNFELAGQIKQALESQNLEEIRQKIDLMLQNMQINHEMDCERYLAKIMYYILLSKAFPERINSESFYSKIWDYEHKIAYLMLINPKINREYLESVWEKCLSHAQTMVFELKKPINLSWGDVFEEGFLNLREK